MSEEYLIKLLITFVVPVVFYGFLFFYVLPFLPWILSKLFRGGVYALVFIVGFLAVQLSLPFIFLFKRFGNKSSSGTKTSESKSENCETNNRRKARSKPESSSGPWDILGVQRNATKDEIRQAYRTLVKKWHPDRFANEPEEMQDIVATRMRDINRAYETLV